MAITPELIAEIRWARRDWQLKALTTGPVDRPAAERSVRRLYANAGLPEPETLAWCEGPSALVQSYQALLREADLELGRNVKDTVFHAPQTLATDRIRSVLGYTTEGVIVAGLRPPPIDPIGDIIGQSWTPPTFDFSAWARGLRSHLLTFLRRGPARGGARRTQEIPDFWHDGFGQRHFAWLGHYDFIARRLGLAWEVEGLAPILELAGNVGWVVPFEHVCWLVERPTVLSRDTEGRLHSATGPALAYADGSSWYAWKGIPVPAWTIERPHDITPERIEEETDPVLRRCLIEIITPERFIRTSGATCISEDSSGKLWVKLWRASSLDGWAAVEVVNGTPEPDGSHKHYFLQVPFTVRTARAAVAWTYGMSERQYAALSVRT